MDLPCDLHGRTIAEVRALAAASLRLDLDAQIVGTCSDCGEPITGLDRQCTSEWLDPDTRQTIVERYHAQCLGCDLSEADRQTGCEVCGRVRWVGNRLVEGSGTVPVPLPEEQKGW